MLLEFETVGPATHVFPRSSLTDVTEPTPLNRTPTISALPAPAGLGSVIFRDVAKLLSMPPATCCTSVGVAGCEGDVVAETVAAGADSFPARSNAVTEYVNVVAAASPTSVYVNCEVV